jgi:hypothetical protein
MLILVFNLSSPDHTLRCGRATPSLWTTRALTKPSAVSRVNPSSQHLCHVPAWAMFLNHTTSLVAKLSYTTPLIWLKGHTGLPLGPTNMRGRQLSNLCIWHMGPTVWLVGSGWPLTFPLWLGQQWSLTSQLTLQSNPKPSIWFSNLLTCVVCALSQLIKFIKYFFIW